jgi:hypothetical protein
MNDRDVFLGCHVTEDVKESLQEEAIKRGISMSSLVSRVLSKTLKELGYDVEYEETTAI